MVLSGLIFWLLLVVSVALEVCYFDYLVVVDIQLVSFCLRVLLLDTLREVVLWETMILLCISVVVWQYSFVVCSSSDTCSFG